MEEGEEILKSHEKITALKQMGYTVHVQHLRYVWDWEAPVTDKMWREGKMQRGLNPCGGITTVEVAKETDIHRASANCSHRENFNKQIGLDIALGRVLKKMPTVSEDKLRDALGASV